MTLPPTESRRAFAVSRRNLRSIPFDELVPLASIPGHPKSSQVKISKEIWPAVRTIVHTVTIAFESGASPVTGLFLANCPAAAVIDQPVLLPFYYQSYRL